MSSGDLKELKRRIYEQERIFELLEKLGCDHVKPENGGALFTAALPNGNNPRSVQVYNNEYLVSSIRTRGIAGDIYHIVAYILYEADDEESFKNCLPKVKKFIAEQLEYTDFLNGSYKPKPEVNGWLKKIKRERSKGIDLDAIKINELLDESIMNEYFMIPHAEWIDDGISYDTQVEFECGFDLDSKRIVVMIRDRYGNLIGVKGRTVEENYEDWGIPKYLYLYKMNKGIELYNLHRALPYILEKKEIIVFEGFKSVMKAWEYGYKNCVSIEGDSISPTQVALIKSLGLDLNVILSFDKDKSILDVKSQAKKISNRNLFAIFDKKHALSEKQSPVDVGQVVWNFLYRNKFIIPNGGAMTYN
jgi:DNA primase